MTRLDKQIHWVTRFKAEMMSAYRCAKNQHSFDWILDRINDTVYTHDQYKKLPSWARQQLAGYSAALLDMNYQNLEFAHIYDGKFYLELPYGPEFTQAKLQDSYHVWKGTQIKF